MIDCILSDRSWQFIFAFIVDRICTISHIIVLSGVHHRLYILGLVMTVQFHFWHWVDLNNQSRRCPISPSSLTGHYPIGLDSSILYFTEITLVRWVTLLFYLLFVVNRILFYRLWQFNSNFTLDRTCAITHVIVLSDLRHRLYPVRSIMTVQFCSQHRAGLIDRSHRCPVSSLS